ncbi:hypothetical protein B0J11DRAFT_172043 [Dendryphion nanum]|uniref:Uncharacterized protein n=1 Tax=Dendryphion nanum TaxID=256645 RepID=A0A9P9EFW4_9PLEO|nr:hypothetical protein B0J11DRAFT_172043 [Dendryphion nanum]
MDLLIMTRSWPVHLHLGPSLISLVYFFIHHLLERSPGSETRGAAFPSHLFATRVSLLLESCHVWADIVYFLAVYLLGLFAPSSLGWWGLDVALHCIVGYG